MKKIIFTFCLLFIASLGFSQLKVITNGYVGINESNPPEPLTLTTSGAPANFLIRRSDSGNFMKAVGGTNGTAYFFKKQNFFALTPGDNQSDQTTDFANSIVLYGPSAAGAKAGNVGIGTQVPVEKLHVNGAVQATAFNVVSDKRLKSNVSKFKYGLDELLQLNPISYEYNGLGGTNAGDYHIGIYAQELQDVAPELVKEFTHYEYNKNTLHEAEQIISQENFLAIKDNEIKYLMINAIKDQQVIIENQSELIDKLVHQVNDLEDLVITQLNDQEVVVNTNIELSNYDFGSLEQNKPNPFNGLTKINYVLPTDSKSAVINFYDANGKLIKTSSLDHVGKGQITLTASDIPSGNYTYNLVVDGVVIDAKKMILTK